MKHKSQRGEVTERSATGPRSQRPPTLQCAEDWEALIFPWPLRPGTGRAPKTSREFVGKLREHTIQRGVALVITLIMLSVITIMAVAFHGRRRLEPCRAASCVGLQQERP